MCMVRINLSDLANFPSQQWNNDIDPADLALLGVSRAYRRAKSPLNVGKFSKKLNCSASKSLCFAREIFILTFYSKFHNLASI